MLQGIRDNAQGWLAWVIVGLISIPFALWGVHEYLQPTRSTAVAEVNNVEILDADFRFNVQQQRMRLRQMLKQNIDLSFMDKEIKSNTLSQMIDQEVLVQSALNQGFWVSDGILSTRIKMMFQQEGNNFSQENYEYLLRSRGLTPTKFESQMRRDMLVAQLQTGVYVSNFTTEHEEKLQAQLEKQGRLVSYLTIPAQRFEAEITVTDAEIEAYYNENKILRYMTPETVGIEYVELDKKVLATEEVSEERLKDQYQDRKASFTQLPQWQISHILIEEQDITKLNEAKKEAEEILAKIKAGEDFSELAKQYSDDTMTNKKGGNLGWISEDQKIPSLPEGAMTSLKETLASMKVNDVSEPIQTSFGFHIVQLLDAKEKYTKPFEEVRVELEKMLQEEEADSRYYALFDRFANLSFEQPHSLDSLIEALNLTKQETEPFARGFIGKEGTVLSHKKVVEAAFDDMVLKEGNNSDPIEIGQQHAVVLRVKAHQASEPKPLETVKEEIKATLIAEKTKEKAKTLGEELLTQLKQAEVDPHQIVKSVGLAWLPAQWVTRTGTTSVNPNIVNQSFKLGRPAKGKAFYQGLNLNNDYTLIALLAIKDGEFAPQSKDPLLQADLQNKQRQQMALGETDFQQLIAGLKSQADIKIHQSQDAAN